MTGSNCQLIPENNKYLINNHLNFIRMKFLVFCFSAFMLCSCNTKNSVDNAATNDIVAEVNG